MNIHTSFLPTQPHCKNPESTTSDEVLPVDKVEYAVVSCVWTLSQFHGIFINIVKSSWNDGFQLSHSSIVVS